MTATITIQDTVLSSWITLYLQQRRLQKGIAKEKLMHKYKLSPARRFVKNVFQWATVLVS
jgi:hypothetical protein